MGISTNTTNKILHRVVGAINAEFKEEFLKFPTTDKLRELADENFEKYHLPDFAFAVDGCHFIFEDKPRGLPPGRDTDQFMNRKNRPSLNVQLIGGKDRTIFDVDFRCPGRMHDAKVWRFSQAKQYVEQRYPRFLLAGDAGYPRSTVVVVPYTEAEAQNDDRKRLFNLRLADS